MATSRSTCGVWSAPVAISFGIAVGAQLLLVRWIARIYPSIPPKIPYGTTGRQYFWYGPREVVWLAPVSWLLILTAAGVAIARAPSGVRTHPMMAAPFLLLAVATPVLALAIQDKVNAARRSD